MSMTQSRSRTDALVDIVRGLNEPLGQQLQSAIDEERNAHYYSMEHLRRELADAEAQQERNH